MRSRVLPSFPITAPIAILKMCRDDSGDNADHLDIIHSNRRSAVGAKASLLLNRTQYSELHIPLYALMKAGYKIDKMIVTTLQALSGAGYPGPAAIDLWIILFIY